MKIAIIKSFDSWINTKGISDVTKAIKKSGNIPVEVDIDRIGVRIVNSKIGFQGIAGMPDCGIFRSIGLIRDYEQFAHRIWVLRAFELADAPVINSAFSWLVSSDKLGALLVLAKNKLPVPDTISSEDMLVGYQAAKEFKSVVVKQLRSAMGYGVFKVDDPDVAMQAFSYLTNLNKPIYAQRFMEKKGNGDYRVIVVGGKVIGGIFREGVGSWKSNYAQGAIPKKVKLDGEIKELAMKTSEVLGLDYVGVDIADGKEGYKIIETNPIMSWKAFKEVTGVNPADHIVKHLIAKLKS